MEAHLKNPAARLTSAPLAAPNQPPTAPPAPPPTPTAVPSLGLRARLRWLFKRVALAALVVVLCYFGWEAIFYVPPDQDSSTTLPGEFHPSEGNAHPIRGSLSGIQEGQPFDGYRTNPPTSGPHWAGTDSKGQPYLYKTASGVVISVPPRWGFYTVELPKEALVHSMEHGGVVIWYNDQEGCDEACVKGIEQITLSYANRGKNVIAVPYHQTGEPIDLTAWTRLQRLPSVDLSMGATIAQFVDAHERRYNPEGR